MIRLPLNLSVDVLYILYTCTYHEYSSLTQINRDCVKFIIAAKLLCSLPQIMVFFVHNVFELSFLLFVLTYLVEGACDDILKADKIIATLWASARSVMQKSSSHPIGVLKLVPPAERLVAPWQGDPHLVPQGQEPPGRLCATLVTVVQDELVVVGERLQEGGPEEPVSALLKVVVEQRDLVLVQAQGGGEEELAGAMGEVEGPRGHLVVRHADKKANVLVEDCIMETTYRTL